MTAMFMYPVEKIQIARRTMKHAQWVRYTKIGEKTWLGGISWAEPPYTVTAVIVIGRRWQRQIPWLVRARCAYGLLGAIAALPFTKLYRLAREDDPAQWDES